MSGSGDSILSSFRPDPKRVSHLSKKRIGAKYEVVAEVKGLSS